MDDKAQINPVEVILTVIAGVLAMGLLGLIIFPFVDGFMGIINAMNFPLSIWGQNMMNNLVIRLSVWVFIIPGLFCLLLFIWGIKAIIKKHEYTAQDQQFMNDEFN